VERLGAAVVQYQRWRLPRQPPLLEPAVWRAVL
jgi:hypothetical protein